eukprot:gene9928-2249_t
MSTNKEKTKEDEEKIVVFLKAVGNAPILKVKKFKIASNNSFKVLQAKLRGFLNLKPADTLFMYCGTAFCPSPDEKLSQLYEIKC